MQIATCVLSTVVVLVLIRWLVIFQIRRAFEGWSKQVPQVIESRIEVPRVPLVEGFASEFQRFVEQLDLPRLTSPRSLWPQNESPATPSKNQPTDSLAPPAGPAAALGQPLYLPVAAPARDQVLDRLVGLEGRRPQELPESENTTDCDKPSEAEVLEDCTADDGASPLEVLKMLTEFYGERPFLAIQAMKALLEQMGPQPEGLVTLIDHLTKKNYWDLEGALFERLFGPTPAFLSDFLELLETRSEAEIFKALGLDSSEIDLELGLDDFVKTAAILKTWIRASKRLLDGGNDLGEAIRAGVLETGFVVARTAVGTPLGVQIATALGVTTALPASLLIVVSTLTVGLTLRPWFRVLGMRDAKKPSGARAPYLWA